ncbi:MAG: DUF1552 domain-containing protein [Archangiaceae bacterium]|nr:DUF1552 domain-containing protein [Archangiaceae bacterium]
MSIKLLDRRMFLQGASGVALALPLLESLLPREARALPVTPPKCFVHFRTPHGGISAANMWPADSMLTTSMSYLHTVRAGPLAAQQAGSNAVLSPVLTAPSSVLTPARVAKLNLLRGLDIPKYMAHNFGGALGYYDDDKGTPGSPRPTIDQVMAYSPSFYPSVASVKRRSVAIGKVNTGSYGYKTAGVPGSGVSTSAIGGTESSLGLFNTLLAGTPSSGGGGRKPVVDQVLASYQSLRNGNARLSSEDKVRLDQHIDAVAELQRRLGTTVSAGCTVPSTPTMDNLGLRPMDGAPTKNVQFFQLINEVIAVAMNCGATRIMTSSIDENNQALTFTSRAAQGEDWHNNVSHSASGGGAAQALVMQSHQAFFAGVFMDLVARLDGFSNGAGGTLLDSSLVAWGQESGNVTHFAFTMPVITAGGAGGALKTGQYCDYRNTAKKLSGDSSTGSEQLYSGLIYNQWLSTALLAMDVPRSEWAETTHPGYGERVAYQSQYAYFFTNVGTTAAATYPEAMWQKTGEKLPFLG